MCAPACATVVTSGQWCTGRPGRRLSVTSSLIVEDEEQDSWKDIAKWGEIRRLLSCLFIRQEAEMS